MTFEKRTPIREQLLSEVVPYIEKNKGGITVTGYDIQLQTWVTPLPNGGSTMINSYALILTALGALVGRHHYLSYVFTFGNDPQPPDSRTLEEAVKSSIKQLGLMKVRQLQQGPSSNNAN